MASTKLLVILMTSITLCWGHPLEDYVKRPDDTYTYMEIDRDYHPGVTTIIVNMTSQTWMDETFSSQPVWFHYLIITVPDEVLIPDQAFTFVGIGRIDDLPPDPHNNTFSPIMRDFTRATGAVSSYVSNVPNQPISFPSDGIEKTEDAIIARTWAIYMNQTEPKNPDILLYFPMVKAIVRAMDTVTEVAAAENPVLAIDKFCVGGPSKRGWTTWLTGATDSRVVGLAPMVISLLNMVPNLHHHYESLGGWSWAFQDYYYEGLTSRLDNPETLDLAAMQDPYEMRANLTMPKYIIKAGNDEFFMLDDFQFFLEDLPGTTNVLILEDAVHIMLPHWRRLLETLPTWFVNVHRGLDRVYMTWELQATEETGVITAFMNEEPLNVTAFYCNSNANATDRRDWRWMILDDDGQNTTRADLEWQEMPVEDTGGLTYQVTVDSPDEGYMAFFLLATFPGYDANTTVEVSTQPNVVPNTFAYPPCVGADCQGTLK